MCNENYETERESSRRKWGGGGGEVASKKGKLRKRGVGRRTLVVIRVVTQRFGSVTTLTTAAYVGDYWMTDGD